MRLRNVKNAEFILKNSPYFISNPLEYKGNIKKCFENMQPIHLEIGTGKGDFLIGMARKYPSINFIGIEKYDSVLVRAIQKCEMESLDNLKFMCGDAKNILEVFDHDIETLYLNFSDPWPKKRHHERRLTSSTFLQLYDNIFAGDGHLVQKTDHSGLFVSSLEDLSQNGYVFQKISFDLHNEDMDNVCSEYEKKFVDLGEPIYYLDALKRITRKN